MNEKKRLVPEALVRDALMLLQNSAHPNHTWLQVAQVIAGLEQTAVAPDEPQGERARDAEA